MPTIHDMPLETIEHIITIAYPFDSSDTTEQRARRHFYRSASLVCRDWAPYAQRALWKYVDVDPEATEELVESGGAGRFSIETLSVNGVYEGTSLGTLLTSVRRVRDLKLDTCIIDASWLAGNNWRDLKALELGCTNVTSAMLPAYHFALVHLTLVNYGDDLSEETLVALSRQVSITSLKLNLIRSEVGMLSDLFPLAHQLVRLDLNLEEDDDDLFATERQVNLFLPQCIQLKHLTCYGGHIPSSVHLPGAGSLESWKVSGCQESSVAPILDVLQSKVMAISKLQRLSICPAGERDVYDAVRRAEGWEGWSEIEKVCRQKKIKLSVGMHGTEKEQVLVPAVSKEEGQVVGQALPMSR